MRVLARHLPVQDFNVVGLGVFAQSPPRGHHQGADDNVERELNQGNFMLPDVLGHNGPKQRKHQK